MGCRWKGWRRPGRGGGRISRTPSGTILNIVDRDYFETAGVSILSGRGFTDLDLANTTPTAIVNDKMAARSFLGRRARKRDPTAR